MGIHQMQYFINFLIPSLCRNWSQMGLMLQKDEMNLKRDNKQSLIQQASFCHTWSSIHVFHQYTRVRQRYQYTRVKQRCFVYMHLHSTKKSKSKHSYNRKLELKYRKLHSERINTKKIINSATINASLRMRCGYSAFFGHFILLYPLLLFLCV